MVSTNYELAVNEKFKYTLAADEVHQMDLVDLGSGKFHLLKNGRSYLAEIIHINRDQKEVTLKIGQETHHIKIADNYDLLISKMGLDTKVMHRINEVKAPMPGLVLSIEVTEGQAIEQGDTLLVLEAMKMENVLKSPGAGIIKSILAKQGKPVDKGEVLIVLE